MTSRNNTLLLLGVALLSLAAVAAALVSQHRFEMQPCPWCVLQRLIFVVIAVVALLGLASRSVAGQRIAALLLVLLCGAGIAAALWQHFVAAATASCAMTVADKFLAFTRLDGLLPEIFQPRASCADAAVNLLGLPYEFWSLGLFVLIEAGAVMMLIKRPSARGFGRPAVKRF
jgi:protein dithiol:quinone oxidoreductase